MGADIYRVSRNRSGPSRQVRWPRDEHAALVLAPAEECAAGPPTLSVRPDGLRFDPSRAAVRALKLFDQSVKPDLTGITTVRARRCPSS
jgi:hypothetical protein